VTPARMVELLDGQAATIARLTAELAAAEAEADEQAQLVEKWAWVARWLNDDGGGHSIDLALEAWSDMREQGQGNNT
jgi:hypothetical protein